MRKVVSLRLELPECVAQLSIFLILLMEKCLFLSPFSELLFCSIFKVFNGYVIGPLGCSNFLPGPSHHPGSPYLFLLDLQEAVNQVHCDMPLTQNSFHSVQYLTTRKWRGAFLKGFLVFQSQGLNLTTAENPKVLSKFQSKLSWFWCRDPICPSWGRGIPGPGHQPSPPSPKRYLRLLWDRPSQPPKSVL